MPDGTKVWTKLIGSTGTEWGRALTTGSDGSIYVAGLTDSSSLDGQINAGNQDAFITKFAPDGTKAWTKLIGATSSDVGSALTTGSDGSIYLAGNTHFSSLDGQTNSGATDAFITKLAPDGTKVWTRLIGSTGYDLGNALSTGLDGSIYVAGSTYNSTSLDGQANAGPYGSQDAYITKFAPDGTKSWTKLIGSTDNEDGIALTTGLDGAVYLAGSTSSTKLNGQTNAGSLDAFLIKLLDDSIPPTIVITSNKTSLASGQTATLTFSLSEVATDFAVGDLTCSGGSISNFAGSGTTYTATLTPNTTSTANGVVSVASNKFSDAAGNLNLDGAEANNSVMIAVDTVIPTIVVTTNKSSLSVGQTATINFVISESVSDFATGDVTVSGGTLSNLTGSGTTYSATFTPTTNSTANGVVSVGGNMFSDAAGNFNADGSDANNTVSITVNTVPADTTPPTIAVTSSKSSLALGQTATLTFTISESVTDFVVGDITASGGTLSNFTGSGTSYSATFTPTANSTTPGLVNVASTKFSDAAGNFNADGSDANNTVTMTVDTRVGDITPPNISVSSDKTTLLIGQTANLSFTLSEISTNFGAGDIDVSGGTLSSFTGSGTSYSAIFTPVTNSREIASIYVSSKAFSDAAGNANVDGGDDNNTALLTIDTMVNRAPSASGGTVSGLQDAMVAISAAAIGFRDPDKGDVLQSITVTSLPGKGSLLVGGSAMSMGQVISADEINRGSLAFKGAAMQSGAGYASFGFKVSDGRTLSAAESKITFNLKAVNNPPVVANPIADQETSEGQAFTLKLPSNTFTDLESPVLSYSAALNSGKPLPKWLKFDAKTATFSGTPGELDTGVLGISVKATDTGKASVTGAFDLTVLNINLSPVAKAIMATPTAIEGRAFAFSFPRSSFVDPDRGDVLTYSVSNAPNWLTVDSETGKLSGTLNYAAADTPSVTVTIKATDKLGLSASTPLTIKLVNVSKIVGTADNNTLMAGEGADSIMGLAGNDELNGGPGNDTLVGGLGDDRLTGGGGQDRFVFERAIKEGGNVDTVTDFASGSDTIGLTGSLFAALSGDSDLSDNLWLTTSTSPATARSNLVYDPQSGLLSYDPDGSGPAASIEICTLVGVAKLYPSDFVMV
jgi:Ca2+-binding RTX toxin-like protein